MVDMLGARRGIRGRISFSGCIDRLLNERDT